MSDKIDTPRTNAVDINDGGAMWMLAETLEIELLQMTARAEKAEGELAELRRENELILDRASEFADEETGSCPLDKEGHCMIDSDACKVGQEYECWKLWFKREPKAPKEVV